ncbi:MAG: bifunctional diaminohydroxyphosphoribosylaminopyrimidine deaminase/5-amino-6-(5-phosphoribosylamino)uracil reductase RibD [Magnetococcales bacterium]|nr:bifunctional diaminohydroxyphosphoribosylaminopyrimidine deaminase/5-amino-6-(5-phosphoribosylamino)uracil reductase RibD [Magnetococcales bacterium]
MDHALRLAARAKGRTRPNPMVGCVIVKDGKIVGRGYHHRAGLPHAEVEALREAGEAAEGATAYVSLEPCSHQGRTPPCADGLIKAGIKRVVSAMTDPNPQVAGRGLERLRQAGIEVISGVREAAALELNAPFISWITRGRPLVTIKMAASLDGKIATHTGESQWITGPPARKKVQRLRDSHDIVMVGSGTVAADDPRLNCRLPGGRDPIRLVVDSKLEIPDNAAVFSSSTTAPVWIATTEAAPKGRIERLKWEQGAETILCKATGDGRVDLNDMLEQLGQREITSVLSESGGRLTSALLEAGLGDRLALFLAPKLIGGRNAPGVLDGLGVARLREALRVDGLTTQMIGEDILIEGAFA